MTSTLEPTEATAIAGPAAVDPATLTARQASTAGAGPVTAQTALFTFYDIESLDNVFSLAAYTPMKGADEPARLEVFYLLDEDQLRGQVDLAALFARIKERNPALGRVRVSFYDLALAESNLRLAGLIGLSNATSVNDPTSVSSYGTALRPLCDTDPGYDPSIHPYLAGYNSASYDTVMLALYLMEAFQPPRRSDDETIADPPAFPTFMRPTAKQMRGYSNQLFSETHKNYMPGFLIDRTVTRGAGWNSTQKRIHSAMIASGRHLDVARLNETQAFVGLKRLLGMLGYQILESDKLSHDSAIESVDDLYELLAYNVSDCVGLSHLQAHPTYAGAFELKKGLLDEYPETIYATGAERTGANVRRDRLTVDSSSAKFVGRILCPDDHLDDIETVSFNYPSQAVAEERGIKRVNVLEECERFFRESVAGPGTEAYARFRQVYDYYRSIEGQNFNDSEEYAERYAEIDEFGNRVLRHKPLVLSQMPKAPNNLPYFNADGTESSCFATFSTGGIHGAEVNADLYVREQNDYERQVADIALARQVFPEAKDFVAEAKRQHNRLRLPDGTEVDKTLVLLGSDPERVRYRKPKKDDAVQSEQVARAMAQLPEPEGAAALLATQREASKALVVVLVNGRTGEAREIDGKVVLANTTVANAAYRETPARRRPVLFEQIDKSGTSGLGGGEGATKLHAKFTFTSADTVIHEDFTSYYPNLLRNLSAFYNAKLGEDRYAKIFFQKEDLGVAMKAPGLSPAEKARLSTLRNGTKLILNTASGAGDATHKTPIRMNNMIISMRIIGQLFSWRIGQAQTLAGARIISTNTDGLYSVLDEAINNRVLEEQKAEINIDIEPEAMYLISKDSNNRLELALPKAGDDGRVDLVELTESKIIAAGGGTLACHAGPRPDKSLAHPAVLDHGLARYLRATAAKSGQVGMSQRFDMELGREIIEAALSEQEPVRAAMLFQNVLAAARGSITYPFACDPVTSGGGVAGATAAENLPRGQTDPEDLGGAEDGVYDAFADQEALCDEAQVLAGAVDSGELVNPRALQHFNRVFIVRPGTPGAVSLRAAGAWKVNPATREKRAKDPTLSDTIPPHPVALEILRKNGWDWPSYANRGAGSKVQLIPADQEVTVRKLNGIDPSWSMLICNEDLHAMAATRPERLTEILGALDLDIYTQMLAETFEKNWMNS